MIDPGTAMVGGAVIGAGADLLGGFLDRRENRRFAQNSIQWRVQDALAAGVHPLFALGASPSFPPSPIGGSISAAGEKIGNAVAASRNIGERELLKAQIFAMRSAAGKDVAETAFWDANAAKLRQEMGQSSPAPVFSEQASNQVDYKGFGDPFQVFNPESDAIVRRLNPLTNDLAFNPTGHRLDVRGGQENVEPHRGWSVFDFGDGPLVTFRTDPDQLLESIGELGPAAVALMIQENERRYGAEGGRRIRALLDSGKRQVYGGSREQSGPVGPGGGYLRRGR